MRLLSLALILSCGFAAERPELPVRQVVLYASGVGYLEHGGTVTGDAEVELRFQGGQLNDALKSLVAEDVGGSIGSVVYPSQDPLEKTLASFQVNLAGSPTLGQLLAQVRGAQATVRWQSEVVAGTILGVEARVKDLGNQRTLTQAVLSLLAGGTVRQVPLDEAVSVTLDDPRLQQELARALSVISQGRDQDKRPLLVHFNGTGPREVRVGYVIEMPLWKTSYRLVLPTKPGAPAALQGWALVDNQTDTDWRNIRLSLVSGRPIGFVQDLAKPRYLPRPVIDAPEAEAPRPVAFGGAGKRSLAARAAGLAAPAMAMESKAERSDEVPLAAPAPLDITASVHSAAKDDDLGTLFRFSVEDVTLPRQRSAMIPIITDPITSEAVSIYRAAEGGRHPLAGAWLTNSTGKQLLAGPMTVLEGGAYAGDALIEAFPAGARRLIAFAVDLAVSVDGATTTDERRITSGRLVRGTLVLKTKLTASRTYRIHNEDASPRTLVVEHPRRSGWLLTDEAAEATDVLARYRVAVPAAGEATLTVGESLVTDEQVVIGDLGPDGVQAYATTGELPKQVREALLKAAGLRAQVEDAERQEQQAKADIAAITAEQGRLRENMRTIAQTSALYQRLMTKLNDQETRIEALQADGERLRTAAQAARKALTDYLSALDVE